MKPTLTKSCALCGKEFTTSLFYQKYCSFECKTKSNYQRRIQKIQGGLVEKICPFCGKKFESRNRMKIYCSAECQKKANRFESLQSRKCRKGEVGKVKAKPAPKVQKAQKENAYAQRQENLNRLILEANQCGLSYGWYTARLRLGETFEELRAAHLASLQ